MKSSSGGLAAEVPWGVVTVTLTVPAGPAGVSQVIEVALTTVKSVVQALLPPMSATVAPMKPVPVIVMGVPPAVEPLSGATPVTVGASS